EIDPGPCQEPVGVPAASHPSPARRIVLWAVLILLLLAVLEGGSAFVLNYVTTRLFAHFLVWESDVEAARKAWEAAPGNWDDEIGWPSPRDAVSLPRDQSGAKMNAEFPQVGDACMSAYGDSFVWGDQ